MCRLGALGYLAEHIEPPDPDLLAAARYLCIYWIDHFCDGNPSSSAEDKINLQAIENYPLQAEDPKWIAIQPAMDDTWSACLSTLEGHSRAVTSAAFSPDSTRLASGSDVGKVNQGIGISSDRMWITYNSENILWLPSEYRQSCVTVSKNMIGIGTSHGRVWICNVEGPGISTNIELANLPHRTFEYTQDQLTKIICHLRWTIALDTRERPERAGNTRRI
ncbi:uncharacterized protein BDR25DRAFT_363700 [Lindgomyces ingoldianus]|uniref:Uncharacterized protein n=1 Tax=Lindgomyces ingoldianus TaxID=673940 RepID=A0ACB6Q967_9PLEO|nr:uncharacterized protein BDR25DRAFT_363700 [Lindgomyces ingoldianus]KAF2462696.1 hypothetical protein BDR25DRAFT_363700 [Lindgomyces ingoldianus]